MKKTIRKKCHVRLRAQSNTITLCAVLQDFSLSQFHTGIPIYDLQFELLALIPSGSFVYLPESTL